MSDFIQQALQLNPQGQPWLAELKRLGASRWAESTLPTRKTEAWKYTRLRPLETGNYLAHPRPVRTGDPIAEHYQIAGLNSLQLVFVDGQYQAALSTSQWPEGLTLVRFSEATAEQAKLIASHIDSLTERGKHLFAALNACWLEEGVFLHLAVHAEIAQPIQLVWLTTRQDAGFSTAQRLLVLAEPGAQATLVEHFASDTAEQNSFTNGISEIVLQAGARLTYYRLNLEEEHALHIGGAHFGLAEGAVLNAFCLAMGSSLKRLDLVVHHLGESAHCDLNGVYLARRDQHVDIHSCIEHAVPRCTTEEIFRGIVGDSAQAVFNGRIHIHAQAQKTSARLSNKNLLTSADAEVDTKPELEIYANDVQCAHGATVAQLDEQLLYYFLSRGISRREAEVMLSFGFINELLACLAHPAIGDYLRPLLASHFADDPQLARHIA